MKQLKKTILTLALLIAATTQAWATDYLYIDISSDEKSATICYGEPEGKPYLKPNYAWTTNGLDYWDDGSYKIRSKITTVTFDKSCQTFNGKSLKGLFFYFQNLITINGLYNLCTDKVENMNGVFAECHALATLDLSSFNTAKVTDMQNMFNSCENLTTVDLSSFNTANVENMLNMFFDCYELETIYVSDDWSTAKVTSSSNMFNNCKKLPGYKDSGPEYWDKRKATLTTDGGYLTYKTPGTPVTTPATDATNTSLSLTQPTGNVTISVKYYDQAEFADGLAPAAITGVQASTADPIVTPGTPKTIGTSDVKMGTVKYYASQTALTDADLLALSTDDWSSDVPKATNLSTGDAYVYYYIQGAEPASGNAADRSDANTCSDSDIKAANVVNVTLIAPPTYDVVLNSIGLSTEEAGKWSSSPSSGITPGETVTVTYSGSRKVIGVKAEKIDGSFAADEYIEASWDETTRKVLHAMKKASTTPVAITSSTTTWLDGWYTVSGNVTITGNVSLAANTYLILQDGANLTINGQLVCNDYNLYIYGQGKGDGKLNVTYSNATAMNCEHGLIEIHGGEIFASATLPASYGRVAIRAAGIKVYGGKLAATSASSTGIIFGNGNFEVYGGEVDGTSTAPTSDSYSGIAGKANFFILKVYGGKVKATGNGGTRYSDYGVGINCLVQSGTSDIKFYFSDDGSTWDSGTVFGTATAAPSDMRYAKAE